jgi:hypothetical protein
MAGGVVAYPRHKLTASELHPILCNMSAVLMNPIWFANFQKACIWQTMEAKNLDPRNKPFAKDGSVYQSPLSELRYGAASVSLHSMPSLHTRYGIVCGAVDLANIWAMHFTREVVILL